MSDTSLYERWDELSPLLEKAQGLSGDQLESFCTERCGGDSELESLLRSLLRDTGDSELKIRDSIAQLAEKASNENSLVGSG